MICLRYVNLHRCVTLILVEIFEGMLQTECGVLRIERVAGLAGDEAVDLGLHGGRNAGKLDWADAHRRRGDGEIDGRDLFAGRGRW